MGRMKEFLQHSKDQALTYRRIKNNPKSHPEVRRRAGILYKRYRTVAFGHLHEKTPQHSAKMTRAIKKAILGISGQDNSLTGLTAGISGGHAGHGR